MNMESLAPLIMTYCVEWARERDIGTKYHPKKYHYYVDSRMMARIIRHNGDFHAEIGSHETSFFGRIIKILIEMETVQSVLRKETFDIKENNNFNRMSIDITMNKGFKKIKGRPISIGSVKSGTNILQD